MAENKITRVDALSAAIALFEEMGRVEEAKVLDNMLVSISKRRSDAGNSKTRQANLELLDQAVALMNTADEDGYPASYFVGRIPFITSPQKATAVLRLGVKEGMLTCEKEGKVNKYRLK